MVPTNMLKHLHTATCQRTGMPLCSAPSRKYVACVGAARQFAQASVWGVTAMLHLQGLPASALMR